MRKIVSIIIILSLAAAQTAYPSDGVCLRVPVGMPKARQILGGDQKAVQYLENLLTAANKGECALRPTAKKTMDALIRIYKENPNPDIEELIKNPDIEFEELSYNEFYTVLLNSLPRSPTKYAENLLRENPEIFDKNAKNLDIKIQRFLTQIVQAALLKKMDLSGDEIKILKQYIVLRGDKGLKRIKKLTKNLDVLENEKPEIAYKIISKYCEALYKMLFDCVVRIQEILGQREEFGRGDEHELYLAGMNMFTLPKYVSRNNLLPIEEIIKKLSIDGVSAKNMKARKDTETSTPPIGNLSHNPAGTSL